MIRCSELVGSLILLVGCAAPDASIPVVRIPALPAAQESAPPPRAATLLDAENARTVLERRLKGLGVVKANIVFDGGPECWEREALSEHGRLENGRGCELYFDVSEDPGSVVGRRALRTSIVVDDFTGACITYAGGREDGVSVGTLLAWERLRHRVLSSVMAHRDTQALCAGRACSSIVISGQTECSERPCDWEVLVHLDEDRDAAILVTVDIDTGAMTTDPDL